MVAEADPFEDPPAAGAERMRDDELVARWGGVRLLHEIVRRIMWEEGEIQARGPGQCSARRRRR